MYIYIWAEIELDLLNISKLQQEEFVLWGSTILYNSHLYTNTQTSVRVFK